MVNTTEELSDLALNCYSHSWVLRSRARNTKTSETKHLGSFCVKVIRQPVTALDLNLPPSPDGSVFAVFDGDAKFFELVADLV